MASAEPQRLARLLHEVHQLVHFEQRDERVEKPREIAVHQPTSAARPGVIAGTFRARSLRLGAGSLVGLEHDDPHVGERLQGPLDPRSDIGPVKPAETSAERRNSNRADTRASNLRHQRLEPGLDVLDPRLAPPVALGREVDDVARIGELPGLEHKHASGLDFVLAAGRRVGLEVLRPRSLELSAIPRPMNPTQLTVLTSASASSARMSPVLYSIIACSLHQKYHSGRTSTGGRWACACDGRRAFAWTPADRTPIRSTRSKGNPREPGTRPACLPSPRRSEVRGLDRLQSSWSSSSGRERNSA